MALLRVLLGGSRLSCEVPRVAGAVLAKDVCSINAPVWFCAAVSGPVSPPGWVSLTPSAPWLLPTRQAVALSIMCPLFSHPTSSST